MTHKQLLTIVQKIVTEAEKLRDNHTTEFAATVNYACIFAQSSEEYGSLITVARGLGPIVEDTKMGPVFHLKPLATTSGGLQLLKIRRPDLKRPERGDADFTVSDYPRFKQTYLGQPGFTLIEREKMEMIELVDPAFNVLAYFSHPTLYEVLGLSLLK